MRSVLTVALVALVVVGCGSGESSPTATPPTSPGSSSAGAEPGAIAIDTLAMSGTASKTSPPADLAGDYVLTTKVKGKSGCAWSIRLEGEEPLVELSTSSGTTHQTTVAMTGLFAASYRLVVKSTKCGAWSVGLNRP